VTSSAALRRRALPDRTDLYGTDARQRASGREGNRLVEVLDVDEHIPAEMLARLGERAIGQEALAVRTLTLVAVDVGCSGLPPR
jgi:hypothetical protein